MSLVLLPLTGLTGCSGGSDSQQQLDAMTSWTATMRLAVSEHRAGAISSAYARQIEHEATDALGEARREMNANARDPAAASRVHIATDSLGRAIHALDTELPR